MGRRNWRPTFRAKMVKILSKCLRARLAHRSRGLPDNEHRRAAVIAAAAMVLLSGPGAALAQDTAQQLATRREAVLARLPPDAAQRLFGLAKGPAPAPARSIGSYT